MEQIQIPETMQRYLDLSQKEIEQERIRRISNENALSQVSSSFTNSEGNKDLIAYQLELEKEIEEISHLLSGHIKTVKIGPTGGFVEFWDEPKDDRLKIFTPYGVKQIIQLIRFYINKNTMLSNYDSETITWKIKDFANELNDLLLNKYEEFFYYPSAEDLYHKYLPIVIKEGMSITEKELYEKCIQWSDEELINKLKHSPIMQKAIVDSVHSAYNRALHGEERRGLRRFINVTQHNTVGEEQQPIPQKKGGMFSFGK